MKLCDFCDAEVIEGGKQEGGEDHTILGHRSAATDDDDDEDEDDWWWLVIAWRSNSPQTNPLGCNPPPSVCYHGTESGRELLGN